MADWLPVARVGDCEEEGCLQKVVLNGQEIVLARHGDELFALEDCCSHEDYPLSEGEVVDGEIECMLHGARFDLKTGRAVQLPAVRPVKTYPVEIRGEEVFVQLDS